MDQESDTSKISDHSDMATTPTTRLLTKMQKETIIQTRGPEILGAFHKVAHSGQCFPTRIFF
jgi:hypothetical protein